MGQDREVRLEEAHRPEVVEEVRPEPVAVAARLTHSSLSRLCPDSTGRTGIGVLAHEFLACLF